MKMLSTPWQFPRIFRIVVGLAAVIFAVIKHDSIMAVAGGLLLVMGLTKTGCAGGSCGIPAKKDTPPTNDQ